MSGSEEKSYITAACEASAEMVVEKSRFIAHIAPVSSRAEAERFIADIKDEYRDATHNVPAFVIGRSQNEMWSSEDGEPQGTAGAPVLKMLMKEGITDVCMVITRYFGGIKLGTGGLVRAYTSAAKLALDKAGRAVVKDMLSISMKCDYKSFNKISAACLGQNAEISDVRYLDKVEFECITDPDDEKHIIDICNDISGGAIEIIKKMIVQHKIIC